MTKAVWRGLVGERFCALRKAFRPGEPRSVTQCHIFGTKLAVLSQDIPRRVRVRRFTGPVERAKLLPPKALRARRLDQERASQVGRGTYTSWAQIRSRVLSFRVAPRCMNPCISVKIAIPALPSVLVIRGHCGVCDAQRPRIVTKGIVLGLHQVRYEQGGDVVQWLGIPSRGRRSAHPNVA